VHMTRSTSESSLGMKTVSFDIFDTVLRRRVKEPEDIFRIVAEKIENPAFVDVRKKAQRNAHRFGKEATLKVIYSNLSRYFGWSKAKEDEVMNCELSVEKEFITQSPYASHLLAACRRSGYDICFVSDMYLPSDFITGILDKFNLRHHGEQVFVSCEINKSKRRGTLFPYLKKLIPGLSRHYGDNFFADVSAAEQAGIKPVFVPNAHPTAFEFNLQPNLADAVRATRLEKPPDVDKLWELGAGLTAPIAHAFLQWLDIKAKFSGVDRLLFLARDAQILHALYEGQIPANYVFVSRHSLNNCISSPHNKRNREWLFAVEKRTVRSVLGNCNISPSDVRHELSGSGIDLTQIDKVMPLSGLIKMMKPFFLHKNIQERVKRMQEKQREELKNYLTSIGVRANERLGIVDIGWQGSIQRKLNQIFPLIGFSIPLKGFYLYCNSSDIESDSLFNFNDLQLIQYRFVIESLFPSCHGTTIAYHDGKPVFKEYPHISEAAWNAFRSGAQACSNNLNNFTIETEQLIKATGHLAKDPDWHSADLLSSLRFNSGLHKGVPFLQPRFIDNILAGMPWPEGYFRWKYPGSGGYRYKFLQIIACFLRKVVYWRRVLLHYLFNLRKP
jgi:predicted HAD superfamily hydrolase